MIKWRNASVATINSYQRFVKNRGERIDGSVLQMVEEHLRWLRSTSCNTELKQLVELTDLKLEIQSSDEVDLLVCLDRLTVGKQL